MQDDILYPLALSMAKLPFESRKDAQTIFSVVFRYRNPDSASPDPLALKYVLENRPDILIALCNGYNERAGAMPCGFVLREALKHDGIAAIILYDEPMPDGRARGLRDVNPGTPCSGQGILWKFFEWIDKTAFEVGTDAFNTFREVLTRHKKLVAHWLLTNYDLFMSTYNTVLIQSASYVTKRQSIKLLGELLLARSNYNIMTRYVESGDNLKLCMNLLKDDRRMVQFEGFHIFKIFVANPKKSVPVQRILINNKEKLLRFLPGFLDERTEDTQFQDERAYLIRQIESLPAEPVVPAESLAPGGHSTAVSS